MEKKKSMTSEIMTKNGKYSSDKKWKKINQPILFGYLFLFIF
jgi:hypothetical protein